jgi:NTE family protein
MTRPHDERAPRVAVVLGGGGLKGFAHIGALRAIEEMGIRPTLYAGTSIGALIASAHVGGLPLESMATRAAALKRRDIFRLNHVGMLLERMRAPSMYLEEPLRALCESNTPKCTFDALPTPLIVNTVDIERGTLVPWGAPGLRNVRVSDAVYASCALPGFFPPGAVADRVCVDGGTIDNMPASIAAAGMDAVIAVDVGNSDLTHAAGIGSQGFASIYMRAASVMMHKLQEMPLADWGGPPMLLIRPRVSHLSWFSFAHGEEMIRAGYEAATAALDQVGGALRTGRGVYPRRWTEIEVDEAKCIGCRTCAALAPRQMAMDASGKAYPIFPRVHWSPADGDFVHHCPTAAITARELEGAAAGRRTSAPEREPTVDAA